MSNTTTTTDQNDLNVLANVYIEFVNAIVTMEDSVESVERTIEAAEDVSLGMRADHEIKEMFETLKKATNMLNDLYKALKHLDNLTHCQSCGIGVYANRYTGPYCQGCLTKYD